MANRVHIIPTQFKDVRTGKTTMGWRAFDDDEMTYDNSWDNIPDSDLEFLGQVLAAHDLDLSAMLDWVLEHRHGIYIGDNWHTWKEITPVLIAADVMNEDDAAGEADSNQDES